MIEFNNTKDQTAEEQEELFKALTEKALNKEHNEFEYIKNTAEFGVILRTKGGIKKIIELYNQVSWGIYNEYCRQVKLGVSDFSLIYALRQYLECKAFYEEELALASDMIQEYFAYLFSGQLINQCILGLDRESWHMWDHRGDGPNGD